MTFYVYVDSTWTQVYVEVEPKLVKAWDTTNDSFSCVLKASSSSTPYEPMTAFKIIDDNSNETIMWIINDTVTTFSLSPATYKHTLSIVQYRYFLNKHLVRNTVFNQPRKKVQKLYTAVSLMFYTWDNYGCFPDDGSDDRETFQVWYDDISINSHATIKNMYLTWKLVGVYKVVSSTGTIDIEDTLTDIPTSMLSTANASLRYGTRIRIVDTNNSNYVLATFYVFQDYTRDVKTPISSSVISTINTYIANHPSAVLRAKYDVVAQSGDSTPTDSDLASEECIINSFLNTLDDQETYATIDYLDPATLQVEIEVEYYYYTMYDVLSTLLDQYRLYSSDFGYKRDALFSLPTSGDLYELLTATYPPDTLSFTQCTFYDALTEIFRFYDAGFKFDENQVLDIEYYNDPQTEITSINTGGISLSHTDQNFNNGRVAYYQNSLQQIKLKRLNTRSTGLGVPEQSQFAIILPKPIYEIDNLSILVSGTFTLCNSSSVIVSNHELELAHFVVSENVWAALDKVSVTFSGFVYNSLYQEGTLKFARGSKEINVSTYYKDVWKNTKYVLQKVIQIAWRRYFGINHGYSTTAVDEPSFSDFSSLSQTWSSQMFTISYQATNNGLLRTETIDNKYTGEMLVNQGDGMVDLNKLGLNMLGESLKDGEPTLTATWEITDWGDRIEEGDYITYNSEIWVANVVNYTVIKDGVYQCSVEFSKNYNALSLRVKSDNQKRLTSISKDESVMSEDAYVDYWYVRTFAITDYTADAIVLNYKTLSGMLNKTFRYQNDDSYSYQDVTLAAIRTYDYNENSLTGYSVIPLLKYGAGNCICFEVQYDDPISAGNQLTVSSGWFGSNQYFSQAVLYTDDEGWADKINLYFLQDDDSYTGSYPVLGSPTTEAGRITMLEYHKKPNEIFGLNYEWCFLPDPDQKNELFIGNMFINENAMTALDKVAGKTFYLRYSTSDSDFKYSIMDVKAGDDAGTKVEIVLNALNAGLEVYLYISSGLSSSISANTWSIIDENDNIYFACNRSRTFTNNSIILYFLPKRNRL